MKTKQELIEEFTDLRQRSINWIPDTAREAELRNGQIESFDTILAMLKGETILESERNYITAGDLKDALANINNDIPIVISTPDPLSPDITAFKLMTTAATLHCNSERDGLQDVLALGFDDARRDMATLVKLSHPDNEIVCTKLIY